MHASSIRVPIIVLLAALGLVVSSTAAGAAQPEKGSYGYTTINGASGYSLDNVSFEVVGEPGHRKVKEFSYANGYTCGAVATASKAWQVKPSGKFKGKIKGKDANGKLLYTLKVKGKFKTKTKATGKIKGECVGESGLKFVAKKGGNEVCGYPGPACPRVAALR